MPSVGSIESKADFGAASFSKFDFDQLIRSQGITGGFPPLWIMHCFQQPGARPQPLLTSLSLFNLMPAQ